MDRHTMANLDYQRVTERLALRVLVIGMDKKSRLDAAIRNANVESLTGSSGLRSAGSC
jgi:hypothetical protein